MALEVKGCHAGFATPNSPTPHSCFSHSCKSLVSVGLLASCVSWIVDFASQFSPVYAFHWTFTALSHYHTFTLNGIPLMMSYREIRVLSAETRQLLTKQVTNQTEIFSNDAQDILIINTVSTKELYPAASLGKRYIYLHF